MPGGSSTVSINAWWRFPFQPAMPGGHLTIITNARSRFLWIKHKCKGWSHPTDPVPVSKHRLLLMAASNSVFKSLTFILTWTGCLGTPEARNIKGAQLKHSIYQRVRTSSQAKDANDVYQIHTTLQKQICYIVCVCVRMHVCVCIICIWCVCVCCVHSCMCVCVRACMPVCARVCSFWLLHCPHWKCFFF